MFIGSFEGSHAESKELLERTRQTSKTEHKPGMIVHAAVPDIRSPLPVIFYGIGSF